MSGRLALMLTVGAGALAGAVVVVLITVGTLPTSSLTPTPTPILTVLPPPASPMVAHTMAANPEFDPCDSPWRYQGAHRPYHTYRDHTILFVGDDVPVPSGEIVWAYQDPIIAHDTVRLRLFMADEESEDSALFKIEHHSEYADFNYNSWRGSSAGLSGFYHATWYKAHWDTELHFQGPFPGHIITTVQELEEGEYTFDLLFDYYTEGEEVRVAAAADCRAERTLTVVVDEDRPTHPPTPANFQMQEQSGGNSWFIRWDAQNGVSEYWIWVYRLRPGRDDSVVDNKTLRTLRTEESHYPLSFSDLFRVEECGDTFYVRVWAHGDGTIYLYTNSPPTRPIQLQTVPCPPQQ